MADIAKTLKVGERITIRATDPDGSYTNLPLVALKAGDKVTVSVAGATPSPEPPTPTPEPPSTTTGNILGLNIAALPKSGAAFNRVKALSIKSGQLDYGNNNGPYNEIVMAKAVMGDHAGAMAMVKNAANRDSVNMVPMAAARNLAAWAIVASIANDHSYDAWFRKVRDQTYTGANWGQKNTLFKHAHRANNHGTASEMALLAVDLHLKDTAHLNTVLPLSKARLNYENPALLDYEDLTWQADPSKPVAIGRVGATKNGINLDGTLPEELRRTASYPKFNCDTYQFEFSGQVLLIATMLHAAGYPAKAWGDDAVKRIFKAFKRYPCSPSGDDLWQGHMVNKVYGETLCSTGIGDGKTFGLTDYLYA